MTPTLDPLLTFGLADQLYGLWIADVVEVAAMVDYTRLTDAHPALIGIVNRRGQPLPLLDLRRVMGHPANPPTSDTLFIVIQRQAHLLGLIVDQLFQVEYLPTHQFANSPATGRYLHGIISDERRIIQMIAVESLFALVSAADLAQPGVQRHVTA